MPPSTLTSARGTGGPGDSKLRISTGGFAGWGGLGGKPESCRATALCKGWRSAPAWAPKPLLVQITPATPHFLV